MNFYKHHIGDYDAHTAHLSMLEDAAYSRLMRAYYRTERPIPADIKQAARLVRAISKSDREAVEIVLNEFFKLETDGWHNKRCDEEITAYLKQAETNRAIAVAREAKRNKHESFNESSSLREPSHKPLAKNQKPDTSKSSASPPSGAKPPDPVKDEIWQTGKQLLESEGKTIKEAGSLLGMMCKDYGQVLVLQAIRDCSSAHPVVPSEWLIARCQERRANASNKQVGLETRNKTATDGWMPPEMREKHATG